MKQVAADFDIPYTTVRYTIHREARGTPSQRDKTRKTSPATDERIVNEALAHPQRILRELNVNVAPHISRNTLKSRLKEKKITKHVMKQRPFLSAQNMAQRLQWAEFHKDWTYEDWKNVI
jgi:hypothetical protein